MTDDSSAAPSAEGLHARIAERQARVGVIGLGYVGLPLARAFANAGFPTTGFDADGAKVEKLNGGDSYLRHIPGPEIRAMLDSGNFRAEVDFAQLAGMDAILICVPTPLAAGREPDLSHVVATTEAVARHLRPGQLVVLESTTYPGTTAEVMRPILEGGGLRSESDFYLAYSPEREDPGNPEHETTKIPKVVGGDGTRALGLARALYDQVVVRTVPVSSAQTAEAVKLTENIFRAVNIALVNELKLVYAKMGIDVWEVIGAAETKPFGFMPFYPGPGLGGHCIPIDPFYLSWRARQFGQPTRFIELAGEINTAMPDYVVGVVEKALQERFSRPIGGARILLVGVAYKPNVEDIRETPAFTLIELLEAAGAEVAYHDPYVPEIPLTRDHAPLAGRRSQEWAPERFGDYDAALICTGHDAIDYDALVATSRLVVDTRNATAGVAEGREKIVKA
ncbi:MAG: nucleotide sugar dehydrogenase [Rhodospirillales bacterium]|nr:nucleotide sugar dehydrogenase [Rhodospirillales bacterium]